MFFRRISNLIIPAILLILAGCGGGPDSPQDPEETDAPGKICISFTFTAHGAASRAPDLDGEQPGTLPENMIMPQQIQFMLFDDSGVFLQNIAPEITSNGDGVYRAETQLAERWIAERLNRPSVTFYIMALANGASMGSSWVGAERGVTSIADMCAASQSSMLIARPSAESMLSQAGSQRIPMAGLQNFTVAGSALAASGKDNPLDLSSGDGRSLNMLRALAKIEVIDHINYIGAYDAGIFGSDNNRVATVRLGGYMSAGNQLPAYSQWSRNVSMPETQQVETPSVPRGAAYMAPPGFNHDNPLTLDDTNSLLFGYDAAATSAHADRAPVYSAYVYEFSLAAIGDAQPPYVMVGLAGGQNIPFRLGKYVEGVSDPNEPYVGSILRNHVYRYEITEHSDTSSPEALTLKWTLCPMDEIGIVIPPFN